MDRVVSFPIYPHLKKYIEKHHESEIVDRTFGEPVVKATLFNSLGITMKHVLREKNVLKRDLEKLTARIHFQLSKELYDHSLRQGRVVCFNRSYDRIFKESMQNWVNGQFQVGISNTESIKMFLDYYKINEEEYPFQTARSSFYDKKPNSSRRRKKTRINQSINL